MKIDKCDDDRVRENALEKNEQWELKTKTL
jgi:hypothetical protein